MQPRHLIVAALVWAALLLSPAVAPAATPAQSGYDSPAGSVQQDVHNGRFVGHSSLPFSGLDVALVVMAGGLLLGMGVALRGLSRRTG